LCYQKKKRSNIYATGVQEPEEKEMGSEKLVEEIMDQNLLNLVKGISLYFKITNKINKFGQPHVHCRKTS
jgi:hypothetical protein